MLLYACYFVPLLLALHCCFAQCGSRTRQLIAATSIVATWFFILRFTWNYTGGALIRDSYMEVAVPEYWAVTSQLLSWAVVAMVWSHETPGLEYQVLGVFGAMSASFILWDHPSRRPSSRTGIPVHYLAGAALGLWSVHRLKSTILESAGDFDFWLTVLHAVLLVPKVISWMPGPVFQDWRKMPASAGYLAMGMGAMAVHWEAHGATADSGSLVLDSVRLAIPRTDCQLSIGLDLLFCIGITMAALIRFYQPHTSVQAASYVLGWLLLMPLISPAAVLMGHMCHRHFVSDYATVISYYQWMVARRLSLVSTETQEPGQGWMNLGYWKGTSEFIVACTQLADKLAEAAGLSSSDRVLAVGCGCGEELNLYKNNYHCSRVTGIELNPDAARQFVPSANVRMVSIGELATSYHETLRATLKSCCVVRGSAKAEGDFDKIVALDNVYHQPCKQSFFKHCAELLPAGGKVAVTDVLLKAGHAPLWLRVILWLMNVRCPWTHQEYRAHLHKAGLGSQVEIESLEPHVLNTWAQLENKSLFGKLVSRMVNHLDYAVVVATRPGTAPICKPKPKVAIVGSGMAGCVAAYRLALDFDVTVYESRDEVGLSGHKMKLGSHVVDIPLRMMGECYYPRLTQLLEQVRLPVIGANTDTCFFDDDAIDFVQPRTSAQALFVFLEHLNHVLQFCWAVCWHSAGSGEHGKVQTFGEWAAQHCSASVRASRIFRVYLRRQLSWMFSCTYSDVDHYPADVVLDYIRSINPLATWKSRVVRVTPSIHRLQCALVHDAKVILGKAINRIEPDRTIDGVSYDHIVFATEASAVSKILQGHVEWNESVDAIFSRVQHRPSRIVVHTDSSLMPRHTAHDASPREHWKALNVHEGRDGMSSLTVWLNSYYDSHAITDDGLQQKDVFQTWNPQVEPRDETVLKTVYFQRVKHTNETRSLQRQLAMLQGRNACYFCGSYSTFGVGLLEQAVVSAERVAAMIRQRQCAQ